MLQRTDQFARSNRPGFGIPAAGRRGFTVVEMLVTLAMIIVLVGILVAIEAADDEEASHSKFRNSLL